MNKIVLRRTVYSIVFFLICVLPASSQNAISYIDLLKRLYDMEFIANPPAINETSGNFSSYDRRSRYDTLTNTYEAWGANGDGSGFIRIGIST